MKCYYCDKEDGDLIPLGAQLSDPNIKRVMICAPGCGCQTPYKDTWKMYLTTTALLDAVIALPVFVLMIAVKIIIEPRLAIWGVSVNMAYYAMSLLPLLVWGFGVPVIISPVVLLLLSWLVLAV
jgi:hypothetical protein